MGPEIDQFLHGTAACAGGVEHEAFPIRRQSRCDLLHAGRRHPKHGQTDRANREAARSRGANLSFCLEAGLHHPNQSLSAIRQHLPGDRVQALDVGDRIHHRDVGRADIGADVAGGDRGDQHLGRADGKSAHRRGDERGAAGAARADNAGNVALALDPGLERLRHRGDRSAAVSTKHRRAAAAMVERDLLRGHIAGRRLAAGRYVDKARPQPARDDQIADEAELGALGVERARDDDHRLPGGQRHSTGYRP